LARDEAAELRSLSAHVSLGSTLQGVFLGTAAFAWLATAHAGPPKVGFDVGYSVECRDVTPSEFAEAYPNSKIIEARFEVSSLVLRGEQEDIKELIYVIWSPEKRLRVVDFEPKTRMESEFTDPIQIVKTEENAATIGGRAAVEIPLPSGDVCPSAEPDATTGCQRYHEPGTRRVLQAQAL